MEILDAIKERRSINFFDSEKQIPDETVKELLKLASLSPSSMNMQPWKVIAVRSLDRKKALRAQAFNQPKVEEASVVFIIIADKHGVENNADTVLKSWAELGYIKSDQIEKSKAQALNLYGDKDSPVRIPFSVKNAALFAMSLMIAARGLGLEAHPMDGFDEAGVKKEFGITDECIVPMLVAVGYPRPGLKLLPRAYRMKIEDFVRFE